MSCAGHDLLRIMPTALFLWYVENIVTLLMNVNCFIIFSHFLLKYTLKEALSSMYA